MQDTLAKTAVLVYNMLKACCGTHSGLAEEKSKEEYTMATAKTPKAPEAEKIQKVEETVKAEKVEKVEKKAEKAEKKVEKKAAAKPAAAQKVEEVVIQFGGSEWTVAQLKQAAQDAYVAEGHRASTIKKLTVYVKPEERMAYYVINDKITGSVAI
ncbi:DUF6465 family protein [Lawsonibacter sp. LCP25S3_G6]|uniref:DUF6465 family protein n=2 Tax=unclassified Lawsonibacter TaxID=2617946 RepID=UPI003F9477B4